MRMAKPRPASVSGSSWCRSKSATPAVDGRAPSCPARPPSRRAEARRAASCPACAAPRRERTPARGRPRRSRGRATATSTARARREAWSGWRYRRTGPARSVRRDAGGLDGEAEAARASHPERVPLAGAGQPSVGLADEHEHLIGGGGVRRAPRGQQDVVRLLAVGDDRRPLGDANCASRRVRRHRRCGADRRRRQARTSPTR